MLAIVTHHVWASGSEASVTDERLIGMSDPTFAVPDAVLDDLRARLQNTRRPSAVEGQGWARGTDISLPERHEG
jgi:hypothetical protein